MTYSFLELLIFFLLALVSCGSSPINWLSQTKRNLKIKFLDLNFASRRKLCKSSVFHENIKTVAFILFGKDFIISRLCSFPFRKGIPLPSISDNDILRASVPDSKVSTRLVTVNTLNWLRRNFFWPEEVGEGLANGLFVTIATFAPHFLGGGKFLREST